MANISLSEAVQQLRQQFTGTILAPDDSDYEPTRHGWNLSIDQHPALILVPANAQDVVAGVRFAREHGLGVGVKLTGHGIQHPADNNLLIVTSRMAAVEVDPQTAIARVESGAIWKQVLEAATPLGLAPLMGTAPHVGVVGYTLGGGIGWLARRFGLAADSVLSIDVVTADGVLRHTSPTENGDLFWGLLGGGGNFGVVTALEFKLYPVSTIYGGSLTYPGELAAEALRFFREWTRTVPDDLTSSIGLIKFPALPQVPEFMRGKTQIILRAAFVGPVDEGQALIQPWLDWHAPDTNTFHEMPFSEIATIQNDPINPTPSTGSSEMFDTLSDNAIATMIQNMTDVSSPLLFSELRHAGGAIARVDPASNAIGNREANFILVMGALVTGPEARPVIKATIERYKAALRPDVRGGVYLNFMSGFFANTEVRARTRDAYQGNTFERLLALKAKYDPDNVFRYSYQIMPQEVKANAA